MRLFELGLFSAVGRWLRSFRVRPLKRSISTVENVFEKLGGFTADFRYPARATAQKAAGLWTPHERNTRAQFDGDTAVSADLETATNAETMPAENHPVYSRPARARRQPPSVPGPFSEAPNYQQRQAA